MGSKYTNKNTFSDFLLNVEDQLINFVIRKAFKRPKQNNVYPDKSHRFEEYMPLLLTDLHQLTVYRSNGSVFEIFNGTVLFRWCIIHARIIGYRLSRNSHIYTIDDGTATATVNFIKGFEHTEQNKLWRLQCDMEEDRRHILGTYSKSLQRIIKKVREHVDNSTILIGQKIFVIGFPSTNNKNVVIYSNCIIQDSGTMRDIEVSYKKHLLTFYGNQN